MFNVSFRNVGCEVCGKEWRSRWTEPTCVHCGSRHVIDTDTDKGQTMSYRINYSMGTITTDDEGYATRMLMELTGYSETLVSELLADLDNGVALFTLHMDNSETIELDKGH